LEMSGKPLCLHVPGSNVIWWRLLNSTWIRKVRQGFTVFISILMRGLLGFMNSFFSFYKLKYPKERPTCNLYRRLCFCSASRSWKEASKQEKYFLWSNFICNLYQCIQQIVSERIQWHVEECSVAFLCN
jgi:hypothetical protein